MPWESVSYKSDQPPRKLFCAYQCRQQEVVRQKLHMRHLDVLLQAVKLNTLRVVDVHILLLRDGEELVIVQEPRIANRLHQLKLTAQLSVSPVHRRDMAFPPRQNQVSTIPAVFANIWPQLVELQLEPLLRHLNGNIFLNVVLANLVCPFQLRLWLDKASCVLQQDLCFLGFVCRLLVLVLECAEVPP